MLNKRFERLTETYLQKVGPIYKVGHDILYGFIIVVCGRLLPKCFIKYIASHHLRFNFRSPYLVNISPKNKLIVLPDELESNYFERILIDLENCCIEINYY